MVKVKVEQGWLLGEQLDTIQDDGQYYSFKGIPYAEPPLGKLRFKAPRPPLPWTGVRSATQHGPKCPQMDIFNQEFVAGDEDCLYLNVYSPDLKPASPLPVMVFLHGGGYKSGSGNEEYYGPDFLVSHGVVLVTINYRLEVLGFLCLDTEEVPGNAGLKDQVAALKWVKANIANFGGDPENVTLFGESCGGAATALHILSPMSKGLFKRAISMSGVPFCSWSLSYKAKKRAFVLGKQLGLETNDPNVLLEFLQKLPVEKLTDTNPILLSFEEHTNNAMQSFYFTPVTEKDFGQEHFMTKKPLEALKNGPYNNVDILFGNTSEEALFSLAAIKDLVKEYNTYPDLVVPRKLLYKCTADEILELSERIHNYYFKGKPISEDNLKEFVSCVSMQGFVYHNDSFFSKLPKLNNSQIYMYKFSTVSSRNVYGNVGPNYGVRGASHLEDLMYLFDAKRHNLKLVKNTKEYELVQLACTVFTNFAKYGNPTPDSSLGITWPEYNPTTKPYVNITDTLEPGNHPDREELDFWRSLFASVNSEY